MERSFVSIDHRCISTSTVNIDNLRIRLRSVHQTQLFKSIVNWELLFCATHKNKTIFHHLYLPSSHIVPRLRHWLTERNSRCSFLINVSLLNLFVPLYSLQFLNVYFFFSCNVRYGFNLVVHKYSVSLYT